MGSQKTWKWSDFIENFVDRLLEELGRRGYLRKFTCVGFRDVIRVSDEIGAEAKTLQRKLSRLYTEYEVKARLTLQTLESIIYEITLTSILDEG